MSEYIKQRIEAQEDADVAWFCLQLQKAKDLGLVSGVFVDTILCQEMIDEADEKPVIPRMEQQLEYIDQDLCQIIRGES